MQELLDLAHELAVKELQPAADAAERAGAFPREAFRLLGRSGLLGLPYPERWGGGGQPYEVYLQVVEELARAWMAVGLGVSVHTLTCFPLATAGTPEQQERWLPGMLGGELLGAYCLTEPNAGSNAANQQTTAVADGDHWVLNGTKIFITNAGPADVFITYAATDRSLGPKGISAFVVPATTPGVRKGKKEAKLGIHASDTREVYYENARIPKDHLIGEYNKGYTVALATLGGGRIGIAAQALGIAQAAVEASVKYANERSQFDRKIGEFDAIRAMLADSAVELETARLLVYQAARSRPAAHQGGLARQVARVRGRHALRQPRDPGARRLRLHERVPRRALLARRAHLRDLRGHDRGAEDGRGRTGVEGTRDRFIGRYP
jgi:alkylation response protein AidB-like acyl-CoA dehydrogenase